MTKIIKYFIILIITTTGYGKALASLNCSLSSVPPVDFDVINMLDTNFESTSSIISVTCSAIGLKRVRYVIIFSDGNSGNANDRRLYKINSSDNIKYNIYDSVNYSQVLVNGWAGSSFFSANYCLNNTTRTDNFIIHGKIPVQIQVSPGHYKDTVLVTLIYWQARYD